MAVTAATLIQRVRRYLRDWPELDVLTASVASNGTTITVASGALYAPNWDIEIDNEVLRVTASGATSATVVRGQKGSTAASHANSAAVMIRPHFHNIEILDALNAGIDAAFPYVYKPVLDTSLTTTAGTYEYTVPNMPGSGPPIPYIYKIEVQTTGDTVYRGESAWEIKRGATPKIKFRRDPAGGTLRVHGFGPFPHLGLSDSTDALWPLQAESWLIEYAGQYLLASGEAGRVRSDVQAVDNREQANRVGSSMSAANAVLQRSRSNLLNSAAMPPMPRHVKATF